MTPDRSDVFAALDEQLDEIRQERETLDTREEVLRRARQELEAVFGDSPPAPGSYSRTQGRPTRAGVQQKAAQHHVDAIHDYLKKHRTARQADIARDLRLNSGTVSVALRQLEQDGLVVAQERKDRGSVVWDFIAAASRAVASR